MEIKHKDGNILNNAVDNLIVSWPPTIPNEEWKDIRGFEGRYQVSNMGRVRSLDRYSLNERPRLVKGQILKTVIPNTGGYYRVSLSDGNRNYTHYEVHRLVALHFVPGYKEGLVVNHKNEIKTDNRAENLEWCTFQYNINYSDNIACRRRSIYQYSMDGDFITKYKCCSEVEKQFGTYQGAMVHVLYESKTGIWKGYRWSFEMRTKDQWQEIAKKYKSKRRPVVQVDDNNSEIAIYDSVKYAAKAMGVTIQSISNCCRGKTIHAAGYRWKFAD